MLSSSQRDGAQAASLCSRLDNLAEQVRRDADRANQLFIPAARYRIIQLSRRCIGKFIKHFAGQKIPEQIGNHQKMLRIPQ